MSNKRYGAITIFVILLAATIGIIAYVMANGSNPIGPSTPSDASLDVEINGTVVVDDVSAINYNDGNICVTPSANTAITRFCSSVTIADDITVTDRIQIGSSSEYFEISGAASIFGTTRDSVVIMLDSNNNTADADFCLQRNGVATDIVCISKNGNVTGATIDCDLNTCENFPVNLNNSQPVDSASNPSSTIYQGIPGVTYSGSVDVALTLEDIYLVPFTVTEEITVNRVSFQVTGAGGAGDACRVGLYEVGDDLQTATLAVDWGQIVNDSTGWKHASVSTVVSPGTYLQAILCNSGPSIRLFSGETYLSGGVSTGTTSTTQLINRLQVTAPTAGQYAGGFISPGDEWDSVVLSSTHNYGYPLVFRWAVN